MTEEPKTLGEKIRATRRKLKMTQAELAGTDFTKSFISQVEKGFARPSIKSLQIIASRLNQPISYFLDETQIAPPAPAPAKGEHLLQSARSLSRDGHLQDALDLYEELLADIPKTEHGLRARAYTEKARVLWLLDRKLEAVSALEEGVELLQHGPDPAARLHTIDQLATYTEALGDHARAAALWQQALTIFKEHHLHDPSLELKLQTNVGLHLARSEQTDRARRHLETAMKLAADLDGYYRWGELCHALGFIHAQAGNVEEGLEYTLRAVRHYESVGDPFRAFHARLNAATALHNAGKTAEAWEQMEQALADASTLDNPDQRLTEAHRVQGELLEKEERWDEAVTVYEEAIRREADPGVLMLLHRNRARCLSQLGRLDEAVDAVREAVAIIESGTVDAPRERLAEVYSELGLLLKDAGMLEEAQQISMKSLELFR